MPSSSTVEHQGWPQDVGIVALEIYFPYQYVDQAELEAFDGVSAGKYTIGLGQAKMGFCTDREDINSLCLTVTQQLMEKNNLLYQDIGRLEVGTETIIDKSKSVKSVLMQLFEDSGNSSVEGIDTTNACYGGTAALFNAVNWVESSSWDGRYALVVAGDIAVYATGNARPTGGAGAVAMLVGPNAPLIMERGLRGTHMQHAYDFYKPDMASEYPRVDGKLSIQCYLHALDKCYNLYAQKADAADAKNGDSGPFTLDRASAFVFHSPYCKLVQKSLGRLMLNDFLRDPAGDSKPQYAGMEAFKDIKLEDTYFNKDVERACVATSKPYYKAKTEPTLHIPNLVGNMYTPSLYSGLVSYLISRPVQDIVGQRIVMFSYGSGLASTMYSLRAAQDCSSGSDLEKLHSNLADVKVRLEARQKMEPAKFAETLKLREETHHLAPYTPVGSLDTLFAGTWYLTHVDEMHRRSYDRKPVADLPTGQNIPVLNSSHAEIQVKKPGKTDSMTTVNSN